MGGNICFAVNLWSGVGRVFDKTVKASSSVKHLVVAGFSVKHLVNKQDFR